MKKIFQIFIIISIISCSTTSVQNSYKIQKFLLSLPQENQKAFLDFYSSNKVIFWDMLLGNRSKNIEQLEKVLLNNKVDKRTAQIIVDEAAKYSIIHKKETITRDSIYKEGVECLIKILNEDASIFEKEIEPILNQISKQLSKRQLKNLLKQHQIQLGIIDKRKTSFFEAENIINGEIGENITNYNQLSFGLIKKISCVEYDRGFKTEFYKFTSSIYENNQQLTDLANKYAVKENEFVRSVNQTKCKKRIGSIRYYDGLKKDQIILTQRANLLLNTANYLKRKG